MQLVEQHVIGRTDPRFAVIDAAAFKSKNLYNAGNYEVRQSYIHTGKYLNYHEVQRRMQSHEAYKALPAKVAQQVLMQLHHDWESFFEARKGAGIPGSPSGEVRRSDDGLLCIAS
jgi:putative transposase